MKFIIEFYSIFPLEESFNLSFILADKDNSEMCVVRSSVYVNEITARERISQLTKNHISVSSLAGSCRKDTLVSVLTVLSVTDNL